MVVFFIFLIANVGGSLTPLGDPPLFLGFLHGVSFFWTFKILPQMLMVVVLLLVIYFILDTYHYRKEGVSAPDENDVKQPLKLEGVHNFILLAGVVGSVLMSGMVDWGEINTFGVHRAVQDWVRDALLIIMGILSLVTTKVSLREDNDFSWFPIIEVAYLFIGIFITMIPCLLILKAGSDGALAFLVNGVTQPFHYFWVTGALSSFLDNAPTYLTFFNTALGSFYAGMTEAQRGALADDRKCRLPQSNIGRRGLFRSVQLHRQCSEFYGAVNFRRSRHPHAELFRLHRKILVNLFNPLLCGGNPYLFLRRLQVINSGRSRLRHRQERRSERSRSVIAELLKSQYRHCRRRPVLQKIS